MHYFVSCKSKKFVFMFKKSLTLGEGFVIINLLVGFWADPFLCQEADR